MIKLDDKDVKALMDDLDRLAHKAIPHAVKRALNDTAWKARFFAQRTVRNKMVQRNKWTVGSIQVDPVNTLRISQQESAVGSTEQYMETQEFGGTKRAKKKHGVPIMTGYSVGQMGQRPRTRALGKDAKNRLKNIRIAKTKKGSMTRKERVIATVWNAIETGNRYVFLDIGNRKGIFKVIGGRKGSRKSQRKAKIRMLHDLSQRSVRIPKTPWLGPSVLLASLQMDDFYRRALLFQLGRLKSAR